MINFLNKIKFKKNKRVAFKVLFFFLFSFFIWNLGDFVKNNEIFYSKVQAQANPFDPNNQNQFNYQAGPIDNKNSKSVLGGPVSEKKSSSWWNLLYNPMDSILLGFLMFMGLLVKWASVLFDVAVNPDLFNEIFVKNGGTLYNIWIFIKDLLNLGFIFLLLFSAFSTVFQVSRYHIKNIILWVVLMALLVNFSWPITRVIIDASNVAMYFFIEEMLGTEESANGQIPAKIGALSRISDLLVPESFAEGAASLDTTYLILAIIVVFIFGVTLLAFAFILLVRVIALTLLLVFSPIGFVAVAFPSMNKYSSEWWDKLFAYAMKGPIMIFMLIVALKMLEVIGNSGVGRDKSGLMDVLGKSTSGDFLNEMATSVAFFTIPIVILWTALGLGSMGGDAVSGWAVGKAKNFVDKTKNKVLEKGPGMVARGTDFIARKGVQLGSFGKYDNFRPIAKVQGTYEGVKKRTGDVLDNWERDRQKVVDSSKYGTMASLGDKKAEEKAKSALVSANEERYEKSGLSGGSLIEKLDEINQKASSKTEGSSSRKQLEYEAQALRNVISKKKNPFDDVEKLRKAVVSFGNNAGDIGRLFDNTSDDVLKKVDNNFFYENKNGKEEGVIGNLMKNSIDAIEKAGGEDSEKGKIMKNGMERTKNVIYDKFRKMNKLHLVTNSEGERIDNEHLTESEKSEYEGNKYNKNKGLYLYDKNVSGLNSETLAKQSPDFFNAEKGIGDADDDTTIAYHIKTKAMSKPNFAVEFLEEISPKSQDEATNSSKIIDSNMFRKKDQKENKPSESRGQEKVIVTPEEAERKQSNISKTFVTKPVTQNKQPSSTPAANDIRGNTGTTEKPNSTTEKGKETKKPEPKVEPTRPAENTSNKNTNTSTQNDPFGFGKINPKDGKPLNQNNRNVNSGRVNSILEKLRGGNNTKSK